MADQTGQSTDQLPTTEKGSGEPNIGTTFGHYQLLEEIARGGMGVVYRAKQVNLDRVVALKMILAGQLAGGEDISRFYAEAQAAANLNHPNIVPVYEVGEHNGQHYFSMGYVEGESLADRIQNGPLPPDDAAVYVKKIADAVRYAHSRGVIHRDLKPANVLLDQSGEPKVTDFGLAKKIEDDSGLTETGRILGTPSYMPPEQATAAGDGVTETADIYSTGAILYALLTGVPPFQGTTVVETLLLVLRQDPVPPRRLNPVIPRDIESICLKCLEKDPQSRYASAEALADDLNRFLTGQTVAAEGHSSLQRAWSAVLRETRHVEVLARWGRVWIWSGVVFLVLCSITNLLMWQGTKEFTPYVSLWAVGLFVLAVIIWHLRFRGGIPFTPIERRLRTVWGMCAAAMALTGVINYLKGFAPLTQRRCPNRT